MEEVLSSYLETVKVTLAEGEVLEAVNSLMLFDKQFSLSLADSLIQQSGRWKRNQKDRDSGEFTAAELRATENAISKAVINIVLDIPKKASRNAALSQIMSMKTPTNDAPKERLEKLIGGGSSLVKINILEKALRAAKAVCRIMYIDQKTGKPSVGTGWMIANNYLITNNHVLASIAAAETAEAQFNYESDENDRLKNKIAYKFDAKTLITSPADEFDFSRVRVIDRADYPLKNWGFLEIDANSVPSMGDSVPIIQHPKGQEKQIALNANEVLGVNGRFLHYSTDTEPGSSGSPVFDANWKVCAIHHAGGTYNVDGSGRMAEANQGILFKHIKPWLDKHPFDQPAVAIGGSTGGRLESFSLATESAQPIVNQPVMPSVPNLTILYDQADQAFADTLFKHLKVLVTIQKKLTVYQQIRDAAGEIVADGMTKIDVSKIVVALITPNFLDGDAWTLTEYAREKKKTVVPILIKSFDLQGTGLENLRALPSNGQFIDPNWPSPDAAWKDVVENLKMAISR